MSTAGQHSVAADQKCLPRIASTCTERGGRKVIIDIQALQGPFSQKDRYDLIGKVIGPSFPVRRHLLYRLAEKYAGGNWTGFDRSLEDLGEELCEHL